MQYEEANSQLSTRQLKALGVLTSTPEVGVAPMLDTGFLRGAPWHYRYRLEGACVGVGLLIFALMGPILTEGALMRLASGIPLSKGSVVAIETQTEETLYLPNEEGELILKGPGSLQIQHLSRERFSGRLKARFHLEEGELHLKADPNFPKLIEVQTPLLNVRIMGTELIIAHAPKKGSQLVVLNGTVQTRSEKGAWHPVTEGREITVSPERVWSQRVLMSEAKAQFLSDLVLTEENSLPSLSSSLMTEKTAEEIPIQTGRTQPIWYEETLNKRLEMEYAE